MGPDIRFGKMVVPTMDKLPRVPDTHGDAVNERIFSDLYIRTSWVDADVALDQIKKVYYTEYYLMSLLRCIYIYIATLCVWPCLYP